MIRALEFTTESLSLLKIVYNIGCRPFKDFEDVELLHYLISNVIAIDYGPPLAYLRGIHIC